MKKGKPTYGELEEKIFELEKEIENYKASLKVGNQIDVLDRKQVENELKKSELRFRTLYENAKIGLYRTTFNGTILMANKVLVKMLGYSSFDKLAERNLEKEGYEPTYQRKEYIEKIEKEGEINDFESAWVRQDGSVFFVRESARAIRDSTGKTLYYDGVVEDITERKQAEEALQEINKLLSLFIKYSPIYAFIKEVTPSESRVIKASENYKDMIGVPGSQMVGKTMEELFPAEFAAKISADDWMVVSKGEELKLDEDLNGRNYITYKFPISFESKKLLAGYSIDITDHIQVEKELMKAKEKAEESDRLKSAFLANISHEIRTPMNGILGFSELLKKPGLSDEKQKEFIGVIEKSGKRMLNIINDIIDLSKIEVGQMALNLKKTNINKLMNELYLFFFLEAKVKNLSFNCYNELSDDKCIIITDESKLAQVLTNLIKNALKFTQSGFIDFGYSFKGKMVEFYVKDSGEGISEEFKEVIFERFRQGSDSLSRNYEGAGLGLSISKAYVELLGGNIWVESDEGKGSAFYYTIPCNLVQEEKLTFDE